MSPSANSLSTWAGFTSPDTTAKASISCALRVRTSSADCPTAISSKGRFSMNASGSHGSDDMMPPVDVRRVARDRPGKIGDQTGGHGAHLVNRGQPMHGRARPGVIYQRIEMVDSRGGPGLQRPR